MPPNSLSMFSGTDCHVVGTDAPSQQRADIVTD